MGTNYYAGVQTWVPPEENSSRGYWNSLTTWDLGKDYLLGIALYELAIDTTGPASWPAPDTDTSWDESADNPAGSEYGNRGAVILLDSVELPTPAKVYEQGDEQLSYTLLLQHIAALRQARERIRILLWTF